MIARPPGFSAREDIAQRPQIVLHVLHHVEADHGVEPAAQVLEILRSRQVALADLDRFGRPRKRTRNRAMCSSSISLAM